MQMLHSKSQEPQQFNSQIKQKKYEWQMSAL